MIKFLNKRTVYLILSVVLCGIVLIYVYDNPTQKSVSVYNNYEIYEETRIKALIESFEGVDDVSVLLTFENENSTQVSLTTNGTNSKYKIKGIAVSAVGADDPLIAEKIKSMLCAAYNINSRTVFVCGK